MAAVVEIGRAAGEALALQPFPILRHDGQMCGPETGEVIHDKKYAPMILRSSAHSHAE